MPRLPYDELSRENDRLWRENGELRQRIDEFQRENRELRQQAAQARRASKRQAAPFSKNSPKANPKKPGRKPGPSYGPRAWRQVPDPDQIDETHDACLGSDCPFCEAHGTVEQTHVDEQYQVELPQRPKYRRFRIQVGRCGSCGRRVQGRHPLQTSDALGAAKSQVGPTAQAAVVHLNKAGGLSYGKIETVFEHVLGIDLSRGGCAQVVERAGQRAEPTYEAITAAVPNQPVLSADETGWRVGGLGQWLHVFTNAELTCYVIDPQRGAEVPERLLGADFGGLLVHDGWVAYNGFAEAIHQQCMNHLLNRCDEVMESVTGGAVRFPRQVKGILQEGLDARDRQVAGEITDHGALVIRGQLEAELDELLAGNYTNPENARFAKHLDRHREELFTFLAIPGLDATNHRAEQGLRPAVANRKVWGGNRTDSGARCQAVLMSVIRTSEQQGKEPVEFISSTLRGEPPVLELEPRPP